MGQSKESETKLTPMVRQYREIKARHPDKILLFRLGDFYEMFDNDAKIAASVLNIALTSRNDMPMCGFPHHSATQYIHKLLDAGKKIAVCEQTEDASQAKGLVRREVSGIVTPGTVLDEDYIDKKQNNYLCTVYLSDTKIALSFADISTGEFFITSSEIPEMPRFFQDELARFSPSEIIYNEKITLNPTLLALIEKNGSLFQSFPEWYFEESQLEPDFINGIDIPIKALEDTAIKNNLFGSFNYLAETQFQSIGNIKIVTLLNKAGYVELDDFTLRNLELVRNMQDGGKKFTLLDILDNTITPMGGRLIRRIIVMPLYDLNGIYRRQNIVEAFYDDTILSKNVRTVLKRISDIDRLTTRVALKKALPKGMVALKDSISATRELSKLLPENTVLEELKNRLNKELSLLETVEDLIKRAIKPDPSNSFGGDVINAGFDKELDKLRNIMSEGKGWIVKLQERERKRTGISSLKVKYNKVFGYFIEVSKSNVSNVPDDYIRKQSLVNAERYTIPELSEYEMQITTASEKVVNIEEKLFMSVVDETSKFVPSLQTIAGIVGEIDVYSNLAEVAHKNRYTKPVVDNSSDFIIRDGRHPVVEKYMGFNLFVPNDLIFNDTDSRILIITGPNMAGKSTYLRQNALIAVMAQIGSFVPAKSAHIGMVDKIFTRIGASDRLSEGRSTFLVEMEEAANILKNATDKSLIIMDELGRGTSTYDGLSIAWAVLEYLHEHPKKGGKTLFATHYHELTKLGEKQGIKNFNIAVREYNEELIFLRKVVDGPADQSYGIYVAKLAGINNEIIERAKIILENLETEGNKARDIIESRFDREYRKIPSRKYLTELELFPDNKHANTVEKIRNLDINRITPIEAITFLSELKKELGN